MGISILNRNLLNFNFTAYPNCYGEYIFFENIYYNT